MSKKTKNHRFKTIVFLIFIIKIFFFISIFQAVTELTNLVNEMKLKTNQMSAKMIRELKHKDKLQSKLNRSCDVLTALLQAKSLKRSMCALF